MAPEECGLVKDWVRQGQMTYGQIHTLPHLLGQWQDTKVCDPQSPVGAGPHVTWTAVEMPPSMPSQVSMLPFVLYPNPPKQTKQPSGLLVSTFLGPSGQGEKSARPLRHLWAAGDPVL